MNKLAYFSDTNLETISESPTKVIKKGLVLLAGTHVDSKKRTHTFSPSRLREIVRNSNELFANTRIPVLMDHKKEQSSVIGDVESKFECATVTEANFPGADAKGLTGKMGIFVNEIAIKSKDAIRQLNEGLLNTLSPGIDIVSNAIREISATPNPAIANLSLFKRAEFESDALTFDELENSDDMLDQIRSKYDDLTNKLWELTETIQTVDENALNASREELQMQAVNDFATRFLTLIGGDEEQDPMMAAANNGSYPNQAPSANQGNNWGMPPSNPNARYNDGLPLAAFSMDDMESVNRAEFGLMGSAKKLGTRVMNRVSSDAGSVRKSFSNKIAQQKQFKVKGFRKYGSATLQAGKTALKTKTGKGLAIGTGGLAATGLAVGAYRGLTGKKKQTVVNNY